MAGLQRFVEAQADIYESALAELLAGSKHGHWMWFIFPQIAGLGSSPAARFYAIHDLQEARAYLADKVLGVRLVECTRAMLAHAGLRTPVEILGPVDALKFTSCMTLFEAASDDLHPFANALDSLCDGKRDQATLDLL